MYFLWPQDNEGLCPMPLVRRDHNMKEEKKEKKTRKPSHGELHKGLKKEDRPIPETPEAAAKTFPWMGHYNATLPNKLVEHLSKGYSFESFGAEAGVGRSAMYDWLEKYPEFAEAKLVGEERGLRLFESMAVSTATGKSLKNKDGEEQFNPKLSNTQMLLFLMKTRFHKIYGDKKEIDHKSSDGSMKPTQIVFEEVPVKGDD